MENTIEIKVERIHRVDSDGSLKGFADISLAGSFIVKGLRILSGKNGMFVGMPREQGKNGKWYNRVELKDVSLKDRIASMILSAFDEE